MSNYVAVAVEGTVNIHLPDWSGNYATLCGLDGADEHKAVDQKPAAVPQGARIDCVECWHIFWLVTQFRKSDFIEEFYSDT